MKNIAIISTSLNNGKIEKIAGLLSKKLSEFYNVYLFLLNINDLAYEYGGTIVNIGRSGPFFEYAIKANKEKYKIDVAISCFRELNFANIRTRVNEKVIISECCVQPHIGSEAYAEDVQIRRYYDCADEMVVCSTDVKNEMKTVYDLTLPITPINNNVLDQWIDVIEKSSKPKVNPVIDEMKRLDLAENIFIYGAGLVGKSYYIRLSKKYKISGFVVSKKENNPDQLYEVPIFDVHSIRNTSPNTALIVGVGYNNQNDVVKKARECGFQNIVFPWIEPMTYDYYSNCKELNLKDELVDWSRWRLERNFDIDNPVSFNEKIQWLKLYDSTEQKTRLADKVLVRDYVKETIGEEYLIPCLGIWDSFDDIDWDELPDCFALKCNHASGTNAIIHDKKEADYKELKLKFDDWMNMNFAFCAGLEMHYKGIEPKILAEELLLTDNGEDLKDYKIFVFNGKAKLIQVDIDRYQGHKRNLYDLDWNYIPVSISHPTAPEVRIEKPDCFVELISAAEELGKDFKHVRVDFYICDNKIYFGEMTFTHGSGLEKFTPASYEKQMGDWILL